MAKKPLKFESDEPLEEIHSVLESAFNNMLDGVLVVTTDGTLLVLNPAAEQLSGMGVNNSSDTEEHVVYGVFKSDKQTSLEHNELPIVKALNGETVDGYELFMRNASLSEGAYLSVSASPIRNSDGQVYAAVVVMRNINEKIKARQEIKETTAQLIQSEKLSAIGELAAGLCHELNQPLNVMKIICQSALRDIKKNRYQDEDRKKDYPDIIEQINKAGKIIDHMRVFARDTGGGVSLEMQDVNVALEAALKFMTVQFKAQNIELIKNLTPDLPKINCDTIRLEQVILNLLTNAMQALEKSDQRERKIEVISFRLELENQAVIAIDIKDNGPGVPENIRENIFSPFFTTKKQGEGTGLGLSISTKIIEEIKGRLELESEEGKGATFRILLPIAETAKGKEAV